MKLTFLGTGTSQGIPVIACNCDVCKSTNLLDKRLRSSVLIEIDNKNIVIDTGPDFRQQMLINNVEKLDAIIYTHEHKDHMAGLDDIRAYNYVQKQAMNIYCEQRVANALKREYAYVFAELKYPGIPDINLHIIENKMFKIDNITIEPIRVQHLELPILGYKFGNLAYITDANHISKEEKEKLNNLDILIINALRKEKHLSHFTLGEALQLIKELKPKKAYLTHLSHLMGLHSEMSKQLPENVFFAYDGLCIYNSHKK